MFIVQKKSLNPLLVVVSCFPTSRPEGPSQKELALTQLALVSLADADRGQKIRKSMANIKKKN